MKREWSDFKEVLKIGIWARGTTPSITKSLFLWVILSTNRCLLKIIFVTFSFFLPSESHLDL